MERELEYLGTAVTNPKRPFVAILGGAKVGDKIPVIENLLNTVDRLLIGGGMMFTFLNAQGKETGKSLLDTENLDVVQRLINEHTNRIVLPVDCTVSDAFDFKARHLGKTRVVSVDQIPAESVVPLQVSPNTLASTVAPETGFPALSFTVPSSDTIISSADTPLAAIAKKHTKKDNVTIFFIEPHLLFGH